MRDRHMYNVICKYEILVDFNLVIVKMNYQTAKFNSPPSFPTIWYIMATSNTKFTLSIVMGPNYQLNSCQNFRPYS